MKEIDQSKSYKIMRFKDSKKNKEIFCTLGPSTINRNFLKFSNKKVSLLRLNMSHVNINKLDKKIKYVRKFSRVPICIDK